MGSQEKKEKGRWKKNKHKRKPSLESELFLQGRAAEDEPSGKNNAWVKSQSLESLEDSIKRDSANEEEVTCLSCLKIYLLVFCLFVYLFFLM